MGLAGDGMSSAVYTALDVPQAAARLYPCAGTDDLLVLTNWLALPVLFDQEFTTASEDSADLRASVSRELIAIPYRPAGTPPGLDHPITDAWVQVWELLSDGMSESWCDRVASSWARSLAAHAERAPGDDSPMRLDEYLAYRRRAVGTHQMHAAERSRGYELPAGICAHALVCRLRVAAADVVAWMNDIHWAQWAQQRGDGRNLVAVLQHERGYSRQAAFDEAVWMTRQQVQVYLHAEAALARLHRELWLTPDQRVAVDMLVEGVRQWIAGNRDWSSTAGVAAAARQAE
jgi:germacradienol/geosmin synthase